MAVERFVQHGGKSYGPLTGAALKKLAAEGKISSATQVRRGTEGNWVPAARVQGLFATAPTERMPPLAAPPIEPPAPPPRATPMLQPVARRAVPKAEAAKSPAVAPKVVGGVAIVLGILAVATCWLPVLGGALGWVGIVVGALGLLVGVAGFVLAAIRDGSGLMLNVFGVAGSAVGLVLSIVLGIALGLFAPQAVPVAATPTPAVVQQQPESEPEPPPEPHWFDPGETIEQPPIRARIVSSAIEQVRLENADISTLSNRGKPQPMLKIRIEVANASPDRIIEFGGWIGGGDMIAEGVNRLLEGSQLGKAVQAAAPTAKLVDNVGNPYKQTPTMSVFGAKLPTGQDLALRPGEKRETELVFPPPLSTIEYLRLELSPAAYGGSESLRWQIPQGAIQGATIAPTPAAAPGQAARPAD